MHSGPVTGGFLRGKGARFQLFGDTVTTAKLILAHGTSNKVHLSEGTAALLRKAGKRRWIMAREKKVQTVEKGGKSWLSFGRQFFWSISSDLSSSAFLLSTELQTYWLVKGQCNTDVGDMTSNPPSSHADDSDTEDESEMAHNSKQRWVDWNTDIFKDLLKQILARRATSNLRRSTSQDSTTSEAGCLNYGAMPLDEFKEIIHLPQFDKKAARRQLENVDVEVPAPVLEQLRTYISEIADLYNANPFHNFAHASYVVMAVNKYMQRIMAATEIEQATIEDRFRSSAQAALHDHTYGITSDPLTLFASIFSALIHDVDHPGKAYSP